MVRLRSIRIIMPEIKFDAIRYNPKPSPTPSAPPKTASAVRSIPTTFNSNKKATTKTAI
jgi:hypothetical protein